MRDYNVDQWGEVVEKRDQKDWTGFDPWEYWQNEFEWVDCHDSSQSVISYMRKSEAGCVLVVLNFTPIVREHYRIGVPELVQYREIFNSDSMFYGGSNVSNGTHIAAENIAHMNQSFSVSLTLPPLGGIILQGPDQ